MKVFNFLWMWLVAFPVCIVLTVFTALFTVVCVHWHNAWWVNRVQAFWARMFCYMMFIRVEVSGVENIKKGQSYIFVSNHQSVYDVFAIYGWLPIVFKWVMKAEVAKIPFVGAGCKAAGHIFLQRGNAAAARKCIQEAEACLQDGVSVVVFPEGTRTDDGLVGKFRRGATSIAFDLDLPILPISLSGCYEIFPKHGKLIRWGRTIKMHIGDVVEHIQAETKEEQEQVCEMLRQRVIEGMR